jgi:hypothetical protein
VVLTKCTLFKRNSSFKGLINKPTPLHGSAELKADSVFDIMNVLAKEILPKHFEQIVDGRRV